MQSHFSALEKIYGLDSFTRAPCQNWEREGARSTCGCEALQAGFICSEHKICVCVVAYKSCRSSCLASLRLQCNFTFQFYFYASINDKTRTLS